MRKIFYSVLCLALGSLFVIGGRTYAANCNATDAARTSEKRSNTLGSHYFTCEANATTNTAACPDTGHLQTCYSPITGDNCGFACCICTNPNTSQTPPAITPAACTAGCQNDCPDQFLPDDPYYADEASIHNPAYKECLSTCVTTCEPSSNAPTSTSCPNLIGGVKGALEITCHCPDGKGELNGKCLPCTDPGVCCGIKLNTSIPFIGDCIETKAQDSATGIDEGSAFPVLMGSLMKILITVILIASFVMIVVAGVMIATGGADAANVASGKKLIKNVIIGLAILGALGVILRLINPNFFG